MIRARPADAGAMEYVGQPFLFDYGQLLERVVHSTWTSPEKKLASFQGKVTAEKRGRE